MIKKTSRLEFAKRIWVAIFALATIVFMLYLIHDHHAALEAIRINNPWLLLLAAVIHGVFWLVAAVFWRYAVRATTNSGMKMNESLRQLALVAVGKYIPGKIWGFVARGTALKQADLTMRGVFAATFVEQWAMLMSAGLVAGLPLILLGTNPAIIIVGIAAIIMSLLGNHFFRFGAKLLQRILASITDSDYSTEGASLGNREYLVLLLIHSLMWILLGIVLTSIFFAFSPQPFSLELCAALLLANTIGIVIGFVALFAPGGLGVREAITTAVLLPYIPLEQAAILSIAFRGWTTLIDVLLGIALLLQGVRHTRV